MNVEIVHGHTFPEAKGVCIVIDVLRAFTTAAYAFDAGAKEIHFVSTIEEAFQKKTEDPALLLMGEIEGVTIDGFQYGNSPHQLHTGDVAGKTLVQRTSSGTQGVVGCSHAEQIFATSFVIADATVEKVRALKPVEVTIVATGRNYGDEDLALAEYLKNKLLDLPVELNPLLEGVQKSPCAERMRSGPTSYADGPYDIELATQINRFPFAIQVHKENGRLIGRKTLS